MIQCAKCSWNILSILDVKTLISLWNHQKKPKIFLFYIVNLCKLLHEFFLIYIDVYSFLVTLWVHLISRKLFPTYSMGISNLIVHVKSCIKSHFYKAQQPTVFFFGYSQIRLALFCAYIKNTKINATSINGKTSY